MRNTNGKEPQERPLTSPRPNVSDIREVVSFLCGTEPPRNSSNPEVLGRCADYIHEWLGCCSERTAFQEYSVGKEKYRNVICSFGDNEAPRLVVGAHYDVFGEQPGADDNASGVAALLGLARLLSTNPPEPGRRIDLVAYVLEEAPYFRTRFMGSSVHARSLAVQRTPVKAMVCLEMLGYYSDEKGSQSYPLPFMHWRYPDRGNFIAVVGRLGQRGLARRFAGLMSAACSVNIRSLSAPAIMPGIDLSDHRNYWEYGYPAVMVTDTSFYRNPHYHRASDRPETLNFGNIVEVTRGLHQAAVRL